MKGSKSERRLITNEVLWREANQELRRKLAEADREDEHHHRAQDIGSIRLHFYCECSDSVCHERVVMDANEYEKLHRSNRIFVLKPGHEVNRIEKVIHATPEFIVVEKYQDPPKSISKK
jgi:hypothetical protein